MPETVSNNIPNHWLPNEIITASFGTAVSAVSNVVMQFLWHAHWPQTIIKNFVGYGCGAASIAGAVITIYSTIRLCKKNISQTNGLQNAVQTTLGVLCAAVSETIGEHFWQIAPSFGWLNGHSLAFCIGTNLVVQSCLIIGISSAIFTAFAAYYMGPKISCDFSSNRQCMILNKMMRAAAQKILKIEPCVQGILRAVSFFQLLLWS